MKKYFRKVLLLAVATQTIHLFFKPNYDGIAESLSRMVLILLAGLVYYPIRKGIYRFWPPKPEYVLGECSHCEGSLEFPEHGVGETIFCPHCGNQTLLVANGDEKPAIRRQKWLLRGIGVAYVLLFLISLFTPQPPAVAQAKVEVARPRVVESIRAETPPPERGTLIFDDELPTWNRSTAQPYLAPQDPVSMEIRARTYQQMQRNYLEGVIRLEQARAEQLRLQNEQRERDAWNRRMELQLRQPRFNYYYITEHCHEHDSADCFLCD